MRIVLGTDGGLRAKAGGMVAMRPATEERLGGIIVGDGLEVTPAGVLSVSGSAARMQTVSGSAAAITPENNTIYQCGELTSLTIVNPPADGMYVIIFTSGATPTTTTIPVTIHGFEDFAAEANRRYEINVLSNYALIAGWEVTE